MQPTQSGVSISALAGTFTNSGTVEASDENDYDMALKINSGAGTVTNCASGLLDGRIRIRGTITVNNNGTIALPEETDTSSIDGDYNQSAGGTLQIAASSTSSYSDLTVGGTATFAAGTTIDVDVATFNTLIAGNQLLDVITAGTLTATTFNVTDNSALLNFTALVDGNTIDLSATDGQSISATSTFANMPIASGAARVLDSSPSGLADTIAALNLLSTDKEVADAVETLLPGISGGMSQLTVTAVNAVTGIVSSRQDITRGLAAGDNFMSNKHAWIKPFGNWTDQDDRQGVTGYNIDSYGTALGIDGDITTNWNVGFALAYINSDVDSNLAAGKHRVDIESYLAKFYARHMIDANTALNLQVGLGMSNYDSHRRLFTGDVASADYDSWNVQAKAQLERSFKLSDKTNAMPYVFADYNYVDVESYAESGAGANNLNVDSDSADSLVIGLGSKLNHTVSDALVLSANADLGYDTMTDRTNVTASFAGGGATFTTQGITPSKLVYNLGVGAKFSQSEMTEIIVGYELNGRSDYTDQTVSANFRFMF